jgi:hypothetical protein
VLLLLLVLVLACQVDVQLQQDRRQNHLLILWSAAPGVVVWLQQQLV